MKQWHPEVNFFSVQRQLLRRIQIVAPSSLPHQPNPMHTQLSTMNNPTHQCSLHRHENKFLHYRSWIHLALVCATRAHVISSYSALRWCELPQHQIAVTSYRIQSTTFQRPCLNRLACRSFMKTRHSTAPGQACQACHNNLQSMLFEDFCATVLSYHLHW